MEKVSEGKAEKIFRELGKKLDELFEKSKLSGGEVKEDIKKGFDDLKTAGTKLEDEFKQFVDNKDGKWNDVQSHLEKAADELKTALEKAFKKKA